MKRNSPPLKPSAIVNFRKTDSRLSNIIGNFWKLVWGNDNPHSWPMPFGLKQDFFPLSALMGGEEKQWKHLPE